MFLSIVYRQISYLAFLWHIYFLFRLYKLKTDHTSTFPVSKQYFTLYNNYIVRLKSAKIISVNVYKLTG